MAPLVLFYYIKEAFRSIFRNNWMSLASIAVVAVTLFILGSFMLLNINVEYLTEEIKGQVEIIAYVERDIDTEDLDELRIRVIRLPQVEEVRFVDRYEALLRLKDQLGDMVAGYGEGRPSPLRDSFEIRTNIPEDIPAVAALLREMPGIASLDYGQDIVERLFQFTSAVRWVGLAFMLGLALTAAFLIANTIRLTVNARAGEIMIMKYVGATEWFIRWPFLIEGMLLGAFGALLPRFLLTYMYGQVVAWAELNLVFLPLVSPGAILGEMGTTLLVLGTGIGCLGSLVSIRRFLRV